MNLIRLLWLAAAALSASAADVIVARVDTCPKPLAVPCAGQNVTGVMVMINTAHFTADAYLIVLTVTDRTGGDRVIRKWYGRGENEPTESGWEFTYFATGDYQSAAAEVQALAATGRSIVNTR